jgi:hypothetical protein
MSTVPKCRSCGAILAPGDTHDCHGRTVTAPAHEGNNFNFIWVAAETVAEIGSGALNVVGSVAEGTVEVLGAIAGGLLSD